MMYEAMRPWIIYSGQDKIMLPKTTPTANTNGYGNLVFLLSPNREASKKLLYGTDIGYAASFYKAFTTDSYYRVKIGPRKIVKNLLADMNKYYGGSSSNVEKNARIKYYSVMNRNGIMEKKQNLIVDLGQWMDIFFSNIILNSAKTICETFANFLRDRISDSSYEEYQKTLMIDLDQWLVHSKDCIVMNKKLLTNPLAIILYTVYHYEELLPIYGDVTLYLVSHKSGQRFIVKMNELGKRKYNLLKARITGFKGILFSAEEDPTNDGIGESEVKAELREKFRRNLYQSLKAGLIGGTSREEERKDDISATAEDEIKDLLDASQELDDEMSDSPSSDEAEDDTIDSDDDMAILNEIDQYLEDNPDLDFSSYYTPDDVKKATTDLLPKVEKRISYKFMPERSEAEKARIERLTAGQQKAIKPDAAKDMKSKIIEETDLNGFIQTTNPNIKKSKFMNFDKAYVTKKMESDIDNAVGILAKADYPIFVTSKEEQDSSDPMNIKKTLIYHMEDAKGNKMTLKFDVPIIIDNSYVYLNGSKKIIGHQFVLKPLVKTEPNTVQLVSFYNKVFIRRMGQVDSNTNLILVYMEKHSDEFNLKTGNSISKNAAYDTPLDFDVIAKRYHSFHIGDFLLITDIQALLNKYESIKPGYTRPNLLKDLPVAINMKTKELITIGYDQSYTEFLTTLFSEGQLEEIKKIKRKPKLMGIKAKMMKKDIPLILFMFYCEGFKSIMNRAEIEYHFTDRKGLKDYNPLEWSFIQLEDGYLVWSKKHPWANLLMNAIVDIPWETFTIEELESKETYASILASDKYYATRNIEYALDNYKNFLMDPVSQEILADFGLPTNLMDLLIVAAKMLCDNKYKTENNMENMRIRSNEVIANLVYIMVTKAYTDYRKTAYKTKPTKISVNPNFVTRTLLDGDTTNLLADYSSLNPVLELEKNRAVTFKGLRGIQKDRAMTVSRRGYDESMLGVCGISTSPDSNVGVTRELTFEPAITSTRGYINPGSKKTVDKLHQNNLFSCAELLTPLGVQHDDPDRTSIDIMTCRCKTM